MRTFGHCRVIRGEDGTECGSQPSPVRAITLEPLGSFFGTDGKHRLIISLEAEDLIVLRPEKTSRPVAIKAQDLYAYVLRSQANVASLARARESKLAKATRREAARIRAADRKITRQARAC